MNITPGRIVVASLLLAAAGCNDASTAKTGPAKSGATKTEAAKLTSKGPTTATSNWLTTMVATPEGGFRLGNPDAKVKLVEYASLTCPHCRAFHEEGMEAIKAKYIATGLISYEYRSFVLNGPDYAAALIARCQGVQPFFGLLNAFYSQQESWVKPFTTMSPADNARIGALPQDKQIAALAAAGKLDVFARTRGIPRAKFDACLADKVQVDKLAAMRSDAIDKFKLTGTPGFIINGTTQESVFTWEQLEPKLKAALS